MKDSKQHQKLIILNPGVFVKSLPSIPEDLKKKPKEGHDEEKRLVYPIEIYLGGTAGNYGLHNLAEVKIGLNSTVLTVFFDQEEI